LNSQKFWTITSGIFGFLSVALGAFGAHVLKSQLTPEMLEIFKTGVFYQLTHSIVLFSIALNGNPQYFNSCKFFLAGIILFSFSLYLYSITALVVFAMITPIGGVFLLIGWILIIKSGFAKN